MSNPSFIITSKMVNSLSAIERLYTQLIAEKLIPSLSLKLSEENQVLATHYSTSIEGNPLSPYDVTNIVLGDQIPTTKSEKEVKNYFSTLNKIFILEKEHAPITLELTKNLHKILMIGLNDKSIDDFRDSEVFVGHKTKEEIVVKHNPPFHKKREIENALTELYKWLNQEDELHPLIKAGIFHHQFAYLHPFYDGNGRLTRILTEYFLLLKNYQVAKFFILDDYYDVDRNLYSDMLHSADKNSKTLWLEYFLEGIANSLQGALARVNDLKKTNLDEFTGEKRVLVTPREEEVLEIIIDKKAVKTKDVQGILSVTRQQAHALLFSLVRKGLVEKFGKTKTSYYKLSKKKQ
jgi:Fic family protein